MLDVWSNIAQRQVKVDSIETLLKTKLINRSPELTLLVAYYKVSNTMLTHLMNTEAQVTYLLRRTGK